MKVDAFTCTDAVGFITYCGVGIDSKGVTPNDWVAEAMQRGPMKLDQFVEALRISTEQRLPGMAADFGGLPRHSFRLCALAGARPVIGIISNWESLDPHEETESKSQVRSQLLVPKNGRCVMIGGDDSKLRSKHRKRLLERVKAGAAHEDVLPLMKKLIRDASYQDRAGTVSNSCVWGVWPLGEGATGGDDAVGGLAVMQMPNFITPGMQVRDIWMWSGDADDQGGELIRQKLGKKLYETKCGNCGTPVPIGRLRCGGCDAPAPSL